MSVTTDTRLYDKAWAFKWRYGEDSEQYRDARGAWERERGERHREAYLDFLCSKIEVAAETGFEVSVDDLHPILKPHQRDSVLWAVRGGRRALFASFGLGKTVMELEWCRLIIEHHGGQALIVLPLGVKQEFTRDAVTLLGLDAPLYVRTMGECRASSAPILLTNYERVRDGDIDPAYFAAASLDEAAVLRSFGSKTYQTFLDKFKGVPYKLVSTATPSPNRYKELIHYAGFLEIADTGNLLTRFFQRDSQKANNLTLYPHKEHEFWLWLSTWALFLTKPSDMGYDDTGYDLPPLDVRYHEIPSDHASAGTERNGQYKLFRDTASGLSDAAREKRDSLQARVAQMTEIVRESPNDHFILWHDLEAERHAIQEAIPESVAIWGTQDLDTREQRVIDFSDGKIRLFATKKELSGSGTNFQRHCHRAIFVGIDYQFNDWMQAIHRIYRFLQDRSVVIDVVYTESERPILDVLLAKWEQHKRLTAQMTALIREHGLSGSSVFDNLARSMGVKRTKIEGERYTAVLNDSVLETAEMPENSMDMILTSIPFGNHYEYSSSYHDFGCNEDTERFLEQMNFLSPHLLRVLRPGRVFACHVKDRVLFGNATGTGMPTMEPFHALCIQHYMRHGFQYFGMITVVTDVVRENNQTYRLGWSEQCKDGTKMGVGCPEYILLFRKLPTDTSKAYADVPVAKSKTDYTRAQWQIDAHGYWRCGGDRFLTKDELEFLPIEQLQALYRQFSRGSVYDYREHVNLAKRLDADGKLPASLMVVAPGSWTDDVWDDINRMRTLNADQARKRLQYHVCPLQIEIVERLITRYTNEGETVFDPFAGLFTVLERAVRMDRKGYGVELNADYFRDGVGYLKAAEAHVEMPTLFDLDALEATPRC